MPQSGGILSGRTHKSKETFRRGTTDNLMQKEEEITKQKRTFSRSELAAHLGLALVTIDRAIAAKAISFYQVGRRILFDQKHIDDFLTANERRAKTTLRKGILGKENN